VIKVLSVKQARLDLLEIPVLSGILAPQALRAFKVPQALLDQLEIRALQEQPVIQVL
jgi:hypothetical protein